MPTKRVSESRQVRIRSANWTDSLDSVLLRILREQHQLGNIIDGQVKTAAWKAIVPTFNQRSGSSMVKKHLQNRLKVLKNFFYIYSEVATRPGWGWDYTRYIPKPKSSLDWETIAMANPKYAKCRDRPFRAYKDLEVLCGKSTAVDRDDEDDDDDDEDDGSKDDMALDIDEQPNLSEGVQSSPTVIRAIPEASLPPAPDLPAALPTRSMPMSPSPNHLNPRTPLNECPIEDHEAPPRKRQRYTPSAADPPCACKSSTANEALSELVEIGRQFLEVAREFLSREVDARRRRECSMEDCIEKLNGVGGLSDEAMLAALDAFKDKDNRSIFMGLNGPLLSAWIGRQVVIQSDHRVVVEDK